MGVKGPQANLPGGSGGRGASGDRSKVGMGRVGWDEAPGLRAEPAQACPRAGWMMGTGAH